MQCRKKFLKKIKSEPSHLFLAKFKDGSYENFRGSEGQFYEVPMGKELQDIVEIFHSKLMLQNGEIITIDKLANWKTNEMDFKTIHLNEPYFACYIGHDDYNDFDENINSVKERWA